MQASIYCPHCHKHTALSVAASQRGGSCLWVSPNNSVWWIGICNGCGEPCLVLGDGAIVYPVQMPSETSTLIPQHLRDDLIEAKKCFASECY